MKLKFRLEKLFILSLYFGIWVLNRVSLVSQSSNAKNDIINNYNANLDENFNNLTHELENKTKVLSDNLEKTLLMTSKIEELISNSSEKILKITDDTSTISNNIKNGIEANLIPFEQLINNAEIQKLNEDLNGVKDNYSKIRNIVKKLQKEAANLKEL